MFAKVHNSAQNYYNFEKRTLGPPLACVNSIPSVTNELVEFNRILEDLDELNCKLVAVCADSVESNFAWYHAPAANNGLDEAIEFPIIGDRSMSICRSYGVAVEHEGCALK
ncbi:unnamed protein product [Echinostoma caproni]|uniref:thioredoxin-dependent peroxiredoxin n=1 Tax=Echinostoma caproni TaxID=27848 RepID=A0A183AIB1_9TREM|nr:unnamed protein product [Echinostoma caproni]